MILAHAKRLETIYTRIAFALLALAAVFGFLNLYRIGVLPLGLAVLTVARITYLRGWVTSREQVKGTWITQYGIRDTPQGEVWHISADPQNIHELVANAHAKGDPAEAVTRQVLRTEWQPIVKEQK